MTKKMTVERIDLAEANAFVARHHRQWSVMCSRLALRSPGRLSAWRSWGTYILASEGGVSLNAAGWRLIGEVRGRSWDCPSRARIDKHPTQAKMLFETSAND